MSAQGDVRKMLRMLEGIEGVEVVRKRDHHAVLVEGRQVAILRTTTRGWSARSRENLLATLRRNGIDIGKGG